MCTWPRQIAVSKALCRLRVLSTGTIVHGFFIRGKTGYTHSLSCCGEIASTFGPILTQFGPKRNCELRMYIFSPAPELGWAEIAVAARPLARASRDHFGPRCAAPDELICELVPLQAAHELCCLAGPHELCLAVMMAHLPHQRFTTQVFCHTPVCLVPALCARRTCSVPGVALSALIVSRPTRLPAHARPKARRL